MNRCILALESDKNDIYQLQREFQFAGVADRLTVVRNHDEAICYLKGAGVYSNRIAYPMPHLMLIDIAAESCGGLEVLRWIKSTSRLSDMLIIATGHRISDGSIQLAYDLGANAVFARPADLEELSQLIKSLDFVPTGNFFRQARP